MEDKIAMGSCYRKQKRIFNIHSMEIIASYQAGNNAHKVGLQVEPQHKGTQSIISMGFALTFAWIKDHVVCNTQLFDYSLHIM